MFYTLYCYIISWNVKLSCYNNSYTILGLLNKESYKQQLKVHYESVTHVTIKCDNYKCFKIDYNNTVYEVSNSNKLSMCNNKAIGVKTSIRPEESD